MEEVNRIKLAILTGGNSVEGPSSYDSARDAAEYLNREKYDIHIVDIVGNEWLVRKKLGAKAIARIDKADFSFFQEGKRISFDCVFIIVHGDDGENGSLQRYFDLIGIPYTGSGVLASALCFNKYQSKQYLSEIPGLVVPKGVLVREKEQAKVADVSFPVIVKPNKCGSSFGVSKVWTSEELDKAIGLATQYDTEVLIEEAISGTEVTIGVMVTRIGEEYMLPITETCYEGDVFDTSSKLVQKHTQLITPARLSDDLAQRCKEAALTIYKAIGCASLVRIDFIIEAGVPYFLEVNTIPGMMIKSSIPRQIQQSGMGLKRFYSLMIEDAMMALGKESAV